MLYEICTSLRRSQKSAIILAIDLLWIPVALFLTLSLIFSRLPDAAMLRDALPFLAVMLPLAFAMSHYLGLHRIKLNAYELQGVVETGGMAAITGASGVVVNMVVGMSMPPQVFVIFTMMFLILAVSSRLLLRTFVLWIYNTGRTRTRVLIYGAGQTGQQLATALLTDDALQPVAFVDDNPTLQSLTIAGLKVHSPSHIREIVAGNDVDRVVLAMPSASRPVQKRLARSLHDVGCEVHLLPSFADIVSAKDSVSRSIPVEMSAIMGRNRLETELPGVSDAYQGKRILVTGAGGSIGSELCRQLITCDPECIVMLDHSELSLYTIERELCDLAPNLHIVPVLGSILEKSLVEAVFAGHEIDVVLHAAAYKHVPMVEINMIEGLRNNVLGTKIVADAARAAGVERFILVSSDKAVRPTSAMGSSKRLAEEIIQDLATRSDTTRFSMVRFGNVLGSSGSVIPLFEDQIANGGPVTVTHSDVTRYFMTVSEAVRLVLLAGSFARGGDVFVLDMGEPVSIRQVARQMIEGAGYTVKDADNPDGDIEIAITGLRPGEKLHEELLIGSDMLTTPHPKVFRAEETHLSEIEMANALRELREAVESHDDAAARLVLKRWIHAADPKERNQINE
ncbi:polysaccharide biosynthesis protein [Mesobacterium pallidum]|uniref:polysaccharide biosynthesis protein n=1 Tax=Mesobacterium pallidum TaxID=2872037 RepID=UPI001EE38348|nr:nucleoside-diphosphate sugar epimerase/dehydratase [Mesobacterium pallidum]